LSNLQFVSPNALWHRCVADREAALVTIDLRRLAIAYWCAGLLKLDPPFLSVAEPIEFPKPGV